MDDVQLDQHDKHLDEVAEKAVTKLEGDLVGKTISTNKAVILQTIALIITLVGLAIAAERRITTIEVKTTLETQARVDQDKAMIDAIQKLQDETTKLSNNQVRVVTLLDEIEKRHDRIDQARIRARK
jgi:uncharacterized protein YbcI